MLMITVKELSESPHLLLDRDYALIRFNKKVDPPRSYGRFKLFSSSIIGGRYLYCDTYNDVSYFIFEGEATSHNTKGRDKFFNSVSELAKRLEDHTPSISTKVLFYDRHIPGDCICRHCSKHDYNTKNEEQTR